MILNKLSYFIKHYLSEKNKKLFLYNKERKRY